VTRSRSTSAEEKAQQFLRLHMLHRQIALHERYLLHPGVLDVLEVLVGPDVLALQSMLFLKGPGKPGQGWHQDSYYIPTLPDTLIGTWIAIDDADEYNGCMWFAKGSGHEPIYPPCPEIGYGFGERLVRGITYVRNVSEPDDSVNTLTPIANKHDQVLGAVKAGDVVFFNGHVLHRSKQNVTTDRMRRAFVGHYCNARSFTPWARDTSNPDGFDPQSGAANGSHILARGDTHLPFARPKFGTPCAALLPREQRARRAAEIVRQIARLDHGLMGCAVTDLDSLDREHDRDQQGDRSRGGGSDPSGY
jgi:ectoine hydroxylase-related dioxygenase (phytanoyl-CoA dioxygenase family)